MKWIIGLFIFFSLTSLSRDVHAQFWKKKHHYTKSTSGKASRPDKSRYRDPFERKSKKRSNINTKRKPFFKSKKKMHKHHTSRKTKKPGSRKFFKPKYGKATSKKKSKDSFSVNHNRSKKKSKKGRGSSNGVFKGRKK